MNAVKKFTGVFCFVLMTTITVAQKTVKKYIKKYEGLAVEKAERYHIPASIILGVSLVESDAGRSPIAKSLNNFFGIKGTNWSSAKKMGYKSAYKEYQTEEESFEHFCQVVKKKRFYQKLQGSADFKQWLDQMNRAEYATAKGKWVKKINATISKFKLYELDKTAVFSSDMVMANATR
jgi:Bax protein